MAAVVPKAPSPAKADAAAASETEEDEVQVDVTAKGDIIDVLEEYNKHLVKNFPHIAMLSVENQDKLARIVANADVSEINQMWRLCIADIGQWKGYDDSRTRAIMPTHCRGDAYKALLVAIDDTYIKALSEDHVDDVIVYIFITAYLEEQKIDLQRVFQLEKRDKVELLIDSCSFDPRRKGGDDLYLDFSKMHEQKDLVESVFPKSMDVRAAGAFESLVGEEEDTDEEEEEESEEEEEDEDESEEEEAPKK